MVVMLSTFDKDRNIIFLFFFWESTMERIFLYMLVSLTNRLVLKKRLIVTYSEGCLVDYMFPGVS